MARVLALSSHVAFGSVGLAAVVPALHWHGHETLVVPTCVLSNHPGYAHIAGAPSPPLQIAGIVEALDANGWLADTAAVITGYLPTPAHVAEALSAVERLRRANPKALYLCDPVMGDAPEGLYLSEATAEAIRDSLLPLADITTPNAFELQWLTGIPVEQPAHVAAAAARVEVPTVLATSVIAPTNRLANILAIEQAATACYVTRRADAPHGSGDMLAAHFLGCILNGATREAALAQAVGCVAASIEAAGDKGELPIADSCELWASAPALTVDPL